jgi:hypothetical protein
MRKAALYCRISTDLLAGLLDHRESCCCICPCDIVVNLLPVLPAHLQVLQTLPCLPWLNLACKTLIQHSKLKELILLTCGGVPDANTGHILQPVRCELVATTEVLSIAPELGLRIGKLAARVRHIAGAVGG